MAYVSLSEARGKLGLTDTTTTKPTGYVSLDQARNNLFAQNTAKPVQKPQPQVAAIKTVQAPQGGFKIGDIIPNIKLGAEVATQAIKDLTVKYLPQTAKQIEDLSLDPLSVKEDPKKALTTYIDGIKDSVEGAASSLRRVFTNDTNRPPTASERVGAGLETAARTTGAVISPITSLFTAAEKIPGQPGQVFNIGTTAKLINIAFGALGEGAIVISNKLVDSLEEKKVLSKQVANDIKPGLGEVFALATQFIVGAKSGKKMELDPKKRGELIKEYGAQDAVTIEKKAKELATAKVNDLEPGKTHTPQEVIDHVINNNLAKTPEGENLLKTAAEAQKQGSNIVLESFETPQVKATEVNVPRSQLPVAVTEGKEKVSKLEARMKGVVGEATPEQIKELGLSTFKQMNQNDQIAKAADYVTKNPEDALRVLKGEIEPPKGLIPESIYIALTETAKGDLELATKLSSLQATSIGQRMGILRKLNKNSPVKIMGDIYKIREENIIKRTKKSVKENIDIETKEIKKKVKIPNKNDWNSFIDSIQC